MVATVCRLQQRQRLRERKESRQKEADAGGTLNRQELVHREAEALKNALALLEEEESESQRKAETARKQKAKKDRKKGDHLRYPVSVVLFVSAASVTWEIQRTGITLPA